MRIFSFVQKFLLGLSFLFALNVSAADVYVRSAASGTASGADWTNAYTSMTTAVANVTRGNTIWVATGAYGGVAFNKVASGSSVITVRAATIANHGTSTGWSDAFEGQATFIGQSNFSTNYWTVDGQKRGSDWHSSYLLKFWNQSSGSGSAIIIGGTNLTFQYIEDEGTGEGFPNNTGTRDRCNTDNCGIWQDNAFYNGGAANNATNNLYVGYSWIHNTGNTQMQLNSNSQSGMIFEYNWMSYNHTGQNGGHDEGFAITYSNLIIRYNVFQDICYNGVVADASGGTPNLSNWEFYGNLIFWDTTYAALAGQYGMASSNRGIVDFLGENFSGHLYYLNNTVWGIYNSFADQPGAPFATDPIAGQPGDSVGSPTVVIVNNICWGCGYQYGDIGSYCSVNHSATCTFDYNASYQGSVPSGDNWQTKGTPAAHDYNVSGSSATPFVNPTAYNIAGFGLVLPDPFISHAGLSQSAPYNTDMLGVTRGANGTWDRGALQLSGSVVAPPTGLSIFFIM